MAVEIRHEAGGKVLEVMLTGTLAAHDYSRLVPVVGRLVRRHGRIRLLVTMNDFHGWTAGALWEDTRFAARHFGDIDRIAFVGRTKWQRGMATFCRPFTRAKVRYFDSTASKAARAWLDAGADTPRRRRVRSVQPESLRLPPLPVFQTRDQTRAFYNKISGVYDLLADRSEAPVRRAGLDLLDVRAGEKVLEIGVGTGHSLVRLADAVGPHGQVLGLDLSEKMLAVAKVNLARAGLSGRVRLRCGDAARLPYADGGLDAAFMSFTLELFDTPEIPVVLRECWRVLRPGGRMVVVGMSKEGQRDPLVAVFEWAHRHFPNFMDCRPIFVRQAVEASGFTISKSLTKRMWIPVEVVLALRR
jgi:ubiquinone/menaquinone biosynthesis C-methylase UbiE